MFLEIVEKFVVKLYVNAEILWNDNLGRDYLHAFSVYGYINASLLWNFKEGFVSEYSSGKMADFWESHSKSKVRILSTCAEHMSLYKESSTPCLSVWLKEYLSN